MTPADERNEHAAARAHDAAYERREEENDAHAIEEFDEDILRAMYETYMQERD